jgi:hypothetical protein
MIYLVYEGRAKGSQRFGLFKSDLFVAFAKRSMENLEVRALPAHSRLLQGFAESFAPNDLVIVWGEGASSALGALAGQIANEIEYRVVLYDSRYDPASFALRADKLCLVWAKDLGEAACAIAEYFQPFIVTEAAAA